MRLLVTGGAGFIGSNFVHKVIGNPDIQSLVVLDSLTYAGNRNNLNAVDNLKKFTFIHGDICEISLVNDITSDIDVIVHFAAESHVDRSIINPSQFVITNVLGTQNLLNAALLNNVKKFIHVSTDEVYGSITEGSWTEDFPVNPNSPYSASKASSDLIALSYFKTFDLDVRITRCSNNYGPYQFPEKVIPLFITNLIKGKQIPIYGTGENIRDWIHVNDHCLGIEKVIEYGKPGEIYNLGGGNEITNLKLAHIILDEFELSADKIEYVKDRKGHDYRYSVSCDKAIEKLGWRPNVNFHEGISETINWYKDNTKWWENLKN
jgi:dTDP-glucose 4,6-dehydratase